MSVEPENLQLNGLTRYDIFADHQPGKSPVIISIETSASLSGISWAFESK